ncbi:MAG TPA: hypothetical protein VIC51_00215 [Psychromonas sp.]
MTYLRLLLVALLVLLVTTGCRDRTAVSDTPPPPGQLAMYEFGVIDSFGVDSEIYPSEELILDPYIDDGLFEVYWSATAGRYYTFYLSLGSTREIEDSIEVYSEDCGPGKFCGRDGYSICTYTSDFYLSCDGQGFEDISELFVEVPERLYLFAEVCDTFRCNYDYRLVTLE